MHEPIPILPFYGGIKEDWRLTNGRPPIHLTSTRQVKAAPPLI